MSVKVDIISGFLGAGKTTLIKKLLEEYLYKEKVVLIENEFGEIGIDGSSFKNNPIAVKEINSGCICCTLAGDFQKAIEEVISSYQPDRIIIEPTGVGKLSDVLKACRNLKVKELLTVNMLITVVNVLRYQLYTANFGEFFEDQITHAKTVILSRTQKADEKGIGIVVEALRKLNTGANIITTPWENLSAQKIIAVAEQDASVSLEKEILNTKKVVLKRPVHPKGCTCGCSHTHEQHHRADEVFDVWGVETPRLFDETKLREALAELEKTAIYGKVLRGKGILQVSKSQWVQFDYIPGEYEIRGSEADYSGRLCFIGKDIKKTELAKLFGINE